MEQLKYVGKHLSPTLQTLAGKPVDVEAFRVFEIKTFENLFRDQVTTAVRQSSGVFRGSIYKDISPQFNAFDHLLATLKQNKGESFEITSASHDKEEFLARVQVRIPVPDQCGQKLFTKPVAEHTSSYVLVSFYIGVCKEFTLLTKENELLKFALAEFNTSEFITTMRTLCGQVEAPVVKESDLVDEAFDPDIAIPGLIRNMRLEHRYNYTPGDRKFLARRFYQSPEGFIFRIEIDGYVSVPANDGV